MITMTCWMGDRAAPIGRPAAPAREATSRKPIATREPFVSRTRPSLTRAPRHDPTPTGEFPEWLQVQSGGGGEHSACLSLRRVVIVLE
jgi:hypothetical protein